MGTEFMASPTITVKEVAYLEICFKERQNARPNILRLWRIRWSLVKKGIHTVALPQALLSIG